jgi:hypothetical protein
MPTYFNSTAGGDGIVQADAFRTGAGVSAPLVVLSGTVTIDPPSLLTGGFAEGDITITGVALGDRVDLFPPYDTQGIMFQASVASANTVTVAWSSCNVGTIDLASGLWGYAVSRRV